MFILFLLHTCMEKPYPSWVEIEFDTKLFDIYFLKSSFLNLLWRIEKIVLCVFCTKALNLSPLCELVILMEAGDATT